MLNELQELVENPDETDDLLRLGLYRLPIGEFPLLRGLAHALASYDGAAELERGLDIRPTGLAATLSPQAKAARLPPVRVQGRLDAEATSRSKRNLSSERLWAATPHEDGARPSEEDSGSLGAGVREGEPLIAEVGDAFQAAAKGFNVGCQGS